MTGNSASRPRQNVYVVADPTQWPEQGDPFVLYHQTYDDPGVQDQGLYYYDPNTDEYIILASRVWALNRFGTDNIWLWNDAGVTTADPGERYMAANAAGSTNMTNFALNYLALSGLTVKAILEAVRIGDTLVFSDNDRVAVVVFTVSSTPIDQGTYFTVGVSYVTGSNVNPQADDIVDVRWLPQEVA